MLGKYSTEQGFAVLMTVVLLVATMLVIVSGGAFVSWQHRRTVLEREYEAVARAHAESCLHIAAARLAVNPAYAAGEVIDSLQQGGSCTVVRVVPNGSTVMVVTSATYHDALATLEGIVSTLNFSISNVRLLID